MDLQLEKLLNWHHEHHQKLITGRYVNLEKIRPFLDALPSDFEVATLGHSVQERPIYGIHYGLGKIKILMWSQMHGNETTTTKALFDLFEALGSKNEGIGLEWIKERCTLLIIPLLNPDGAEVFTRVNAAQIDLNRDAQILSQPESKALMSIYDSFKPNYCFNLHGQRTIYGFSSTAKPSVLSFLAPSGDEKRTITPARKQSMHLIARITKELNKDLEGQIGRYNDGFNIHCTGDAFTAMQTPTVLFEAGHFPDDYQREVTRKYIFSALVLAIQALLDPIQDTIDAYFEIPEHQKCFYDVILRITNGNHIAIQYEERLLKTRIQFVPIIAQIGHLEDYFGHRTVDISLQDLENANVGALQVGDVATELLKELGITITL